MCKKVALASLPAGLVADAGFDPLAVIVARHGEGSGLENVVMLEKHFIDFARRNVLAALDDQFLDPAGDEYEAVLVHMA
ncbi:MAG: hypothetical protein CM15mP60_0390 [Alphaproteobacteria bacterium]|nr:MAG: hypothetical protein CM15mP60_0390 [Alphaproteobacteria bacterium]